jgi:hypothetical protein
MKNTVKILFGAFLALAVIAIASFLTFAPEEMPILVITEVQTEPKPINFEVLKPVETSLLVITTTLLVTTTEPPIITTTPLIIPSEPPVTTLLPVTAIPITTTTSPPIIITTTPSPQMPGDAQGTDPDGYFFKVEDGQRYVWNHVVGWCRDDGPGEITIMDVQSDGYRFYRESDGKVNLDKIITPDGSVISFEEYQIIRESR